VSEVKEVGVTFYGNYVSVYALPEYYDLWQEIAALNLAHAPTGSGIVKLSIEDWRNAEPELIKEGAEIAYFGMS
jgi:hypothetical protein